MTAEDTLSKRSPRFHAARIPISVPKMEASRIAVPTSRRVEPTRSPISSHTGRLNRAELIVDANGLEM